MPQFEIKKSKSYMAIASDKLKYLDITNYLAAGHFKYADPEK